MDAIGRVLAGEGNGGTEDDGIALDLGLSRARQPEHQNGSAGQQQGSRFKKLKHDSPPIVTVTTEMRSWR